MHVIFVEPRFPANQRQFVRALHQAGARVTGIGEAPVEALGDELRGWLHAYEKVPSVCDEGAMVDTVSPPPPPASRSSSGRAGGASTSRRTTCCTSV